VALLAGSVGLVSLTACLRRDAPTAAPAPPTAVPAQQAPAQKAAAPAAPAPTAAPAQAVQAKPAEAPKPASGSIKRGGTLTIAQQNDVLTFDNALNSASVIPHTMLYDPLFFFQRADNGSWEIRPGLVEKWEMSPNAASFTLRQGVKFHDGSDWDSEVFRWNMNRWLTEPKSIAKGVLDGVDPKNPVAVVDKFNVKVNLTAPTASLLQQLTDARVYPMSKAYFEKVGADEYGKNPVGTGPMKFVEWKKADRVILKRNENYWMKGADGQSLPYIDTLVSRLIIDDSVRILEMKAGSVDFTDLIAGKDVPDVKNDPKLNYLQADWVGNAYRLIFNAEGGPFQTNLKLRQAALWALDREAMAKALGQGIGRADKYFLRPNGFGYDESIPYYWYDPEKAKAALKDAGFPNGIDVELLIIARAIDKLQAEMLKSMLEAVGFRVKIDAMERVALNQRLLTGGAAFDFTTTRGESSTGDPDPDLRAHFWSKGRFAKARLKDPEVDAAIVAANSVYDPKERVAAYKKVQTLLYEKAPYGYMWTQDWNWLSNKRVKDMPNPMGGIWDFRKVWLDG
jgi:peptide/nickel transport system substrate-binding protein